MTITKTYYKLANVTGAKQKSECDKIVSGASPTKSAKEKIETFSVDIN